MRHRKEWRMSKKIKLAVAGTLSTALAGGAIALAAAPGSDHSPAALSGASSKVAQAPAAQAPVVQAPAAKMGGWQKWGAWKRVGELRKGKCRTYVDATPVGKRMLISGQVECTVHHLAIAVYVTGRA